MKNQFANDIIQKMLPYIDNAQADKLRQALFVVMRITRSAKALPVLHPSYKRKFGMRVPVGKTYRGLFRKVLDILPKND
jgi:hypothetical protein